MLNFEGPGAEFLQRIIKHDLFETAERWYVKHTDQPIPELLICLHKARIDEEILALVMLTEVNQ